MAREQMPWMYLKRTTTWTPVRIGTEGEAAPSREAAADGKTRKGRKSRPRWV